MTQKEPEAEESLDSRSALRDSNVIRWVVAYTISILGDGVYFLALGWATAEVAGPTAVGVVLGVGALPRALLMLLGGVLADRLGPLRVVIASDAARALVVLGSAGAFYFASPGLWLLIVLALVFGCVDALFMPAVGALPPHITTPEQLARVQGMRGMGLRIGTIAGPAIGGLAMATAGSAGALATAGLLFCISLPLLTGLKLRSSQEMEGKKERTNIQALTDGLRYMFRHRLLLSLVIVAGLAELGFSGPLNVGLLLLSDERGWGAGGMGLVVGSFGAGAALSALVLVAKGHVPRAGLLGGWCLSLGGAALCGLAVSPSLPVAMGAAGLMGLTAGLSGGIFAALVQTVCASKYLGRVTAVMTLLTVGVVPLSYPVTGTLVEAYGAVVVFSSFSTLCVLATTVVLCVSALRKAELVAAS